MVQCKCLGGRCSMFFGKKQNKENTTVVTAKKELMEAIKTEQVDIKLMYQFYKSIK